MKVSVSILEVFGLSTGQAYTALTDDNRVKDKGREYYGFGNIS